MISNYFKIAWRNLIKYKEYSLLNVVGLSLGIAVFLLISEYIVLERSVNKFHTNLPNMVRVLHQSEVGNTWPQIAPGWADKFKAEFPEVKSYSRFTEGVGGGIVRNKVQDISLSENAMDYVEGNFFSFFTFPILAGIPSDLDEPFTCFISKNAAIKYFGAQNEYSAILGKTLEVYNQFGEHTYTVRGVFENMGDDSDIRTEIALSLETQKNKANLGYNAEWAALDQIDNQYIHTYLELNSGTNLSSLEAKFNQYKKQIEVEKDDNTFRLQQVADIHLGKRGDQLAHSGSLSYLYILIAIAVAILFIAWFNYINLYTSRAVKRSNEVGVRKAIGADDKDILALFLCESLLVNAIALVFGIALAYGLQPMYNELIGKSLSLSKIMDNKFLIPGILGLLMASALSALAIGRILSGPRPADTLKGKMFKTGKGLYMRRGLVVFQFAVSFLLIVSTMIMNRQIDFMQEQNLGTDISRLVSVAAPKIGRSAPEFAAKSDAYLNELTSQSFVTDYCSSSSTPGAGYNFMTAGFSTTKSQPETEKKSFAFVIVGHKYFDTYGIKMKTGRSFSDAETRVEWNDNDKVIMNESAIKVLGIEDPALALNTPVQWDERYLRVVGVVEDYHHEGLKTQIKPMIFYPAASDNLTLRLSEGNTMDKMATIEKIFRKNFPGNPFEYSFLDDRFNAQYAQEIQRSRIISTASIMAIFIACLGLFGLTLFTIEMRLKEIGIRKVLGASIREIAALISRQFIGLVVGGVLLATPIAYYLMQAWLEDFAYRSPLSIGTFVVATFIAVAVSLLTVGSLSVRTGNHNPVKNLRSE